jgi:hypothetical protein
MDLRRQTGIGLGSTGRQRGYRDAACQQCSGENPLRIVRDVHGDHAKQRR